MSVAADLLAERLLWPVPRVRWEAARGLATLIRDGNVEAGTALLDWIGRRTLESEVILGLGVIDAFNLGHCFTFDVVSNAVRAPSFLSDHLLSRNFEDATRLFPFRYRLSPTKPAPLADGVPDWFERYWHAAVPPVFHHTLQALEQQSGWPFLEQWKHDWSWLQHQHPRAVPDRPYYFFEGDRDGAGQLDLGQRELYVSAYLRTLAQASLRGPMPANVAEYYALHALTLNPGLAELSPIERPEGLEIIADRLDGLDEAGAEARRLWDAARAASGDQRPLHLTVNRDGELTWLDLELSLAIGRPGLLATDRPPMILKETPIGRESGEFSALFTGSARPQDIPLDPPLVLVQEIHPGWPGRCHSDILAAMTLASPILFGPAAVGARESEILLHRRAAPLSRWRHWYADWAPVHPAGVRSPVNSLTTVSTDVLDALVQSSGGALGVWVRVRQGRREQSYAEFETRDLTFWMADRTD